MCIGVSWSLLCGFSGICARVASEFTSMTALGTLTVPASLTTQALHPAQRLVSAGLTSVATDGMKEACRFEAWEQFTIINSMLNRHLVNGLQTTSGSLTRSKEVLEHSLFSSSSRSCKMVSLERPSAKYCPYS